MNQMMDFKYWSKSDFDEIPLAVATLPVGQFEEGVIIPDDGELCDSGYRCMYFVLRQEDGRVVKVGRNVDILWFDSNIRFDCLPCGYLRFWRNGYYLQTPVYPICDFGITGGKAK